MLVGHEHREMMVNNLKFKGVNLSGQNTHVFPIKIEFNMTAVELGYMLIRCSSQNN